MPSPVRRLARTFLWTALLLGPARGLAAQAPGAPPDKVRLLQSRTLAAWLADVDDSTDDNRRGNAMMALSAAGPEVIPLQIRGLRDSSFFVRAWARTGLAYQRAPAIPATLEVMREHAGTASDAAAAALGEMGPVAQAVLLEQLSDPTPAVRALAASAFPWGKGWDADVVVPALLALQEDPSHTVRWYVAHALHRFPAWNRRVTPALLRLAGDPSASVRTEAIEALSMLDTLPEAGAAGILAALADPDCEVRAGAADALRGEQHRPGALEGLVAVVSGTPPPAAEQEEPGACVHARRWALMVLGETSEVPDAGLQERARAGLLIGLHDPEPALRLEAVAAASELWTPALLPAVLPLLGDSLEEVRSSALSMISRRAERSVAIRAATEMMRDTTPMVRLSAAMALGEFTPEGPIALAGFLRSRDRELRVITGYAMAASTAADSLKAALDRLSGCRHTRPTQGIVVPAESLGGEYRLVMIGANRPGAPPDHPGAARDTVAMGRLEFWVLDTLDWYARDSTGARRLDASWYSPIAGATDIDAGAVGVAPLHFSTTSHDSREPGIMVSAPTGSDSRVGRDIRLDVGSRWWPHHGLRMRVVAADARRVRGYWYHEYHGPDIVAIGLFCAERTPARAAR